MGLSERRVKQKINADPRNLTWADNAAKFGQAYLAKHGWTPNTGLGVAGDGRTTHITVAQKLNMLGIGANRPDGPDAIAWKQAKEFEGLLERLNTSGSGEATPIEVEEKVEGETPKEGVDEKEDKARRKENRREEKRKAKAAKAMAQDEDESAPPTPTPAEEATPVAAPAPRRLAHRARFLAAKRMAGTSSTALSEILGIASTPASTSGPSGPSTPVTPATPTPVLTAIPVLDDSNQITTSTQSVADYFKSKMRERAQAAITSTPVVTFEEPEMDVAPRTGLGARRSDPEEEETRPMGLGFSSGSGLGFAPATGLGFTRATSPQPSPAETESGSHTPSSTLSESADSKNDKKRKRKEVPAAEPGTEAVQDNEATETEAQRKAAKRARKEAKRAAREASGDQPLKKKKRKDKAGEAL